MKENPADGTLGAPESLELATICAHARTQPASGPPPLITPIFQTSVGRVESLEQCEAIYRGEIEGYLYTRDSNANHSALESLVAAIEKAEAGLVTASGMSAIAVALLTLCSSGDTVLASDRLYGATTALLRDELPRFGVDARFVSIDRLDEVRDALTTRPRVLLVETLSNPLTGLADIPKLASLSRESGAMLVVDNTFAPCICRPLEMGADVAMHSLTKLIGGHSDLTLGALAGNRDFIEAARVRARIWGLPANPFECWLALRGAATLTLRAHQCAENAQAIAEHLARHPRVLAVHYPGLPTHPHHARCTTIIDNGGAMLAFELEGAVAVERLIGRLRLVPFAPSLGDTSTTLSYPTATSHRSLSEGERQRLGITPGLVRLSVGIDAAGDIIADLDAGLDD